MAAIVEPATGSTTGTAGYSGSFPLVASDSNVVFVSVSLGKNRRVHWDVQVVRREPAVGKTAAPARRPKAGARRTLTAAKAMELLREWSGGAAKGVDVAVSYEFPKSGAVPIVPIPFEIWAGNRRGASRAA